MVVRGSAVGSRLCRGLTDCLIHAFESFLVERNVELDWPTRQHDTAAMASLVIHEIVNPIVNLLVPRRLTPRMNCIEVKIGSVSPSTFPMRLTQHLNRIQYFKGIMYFPLNIQRKLLRTHSDRNTN